MRRLTFISLLLAAVLCGCAGQELSQVTLIQTLGVDGAGPVELTAVGEEGDSPVLCRARGGDLSQARRALKGQGTSRLELTHVAQVVLGEGAEISAVLWEELTNRESGCGATVWLARGDTASALLEGAEAPCRRLRNLEETGGVAAPTLLEALSALAREGEVDLPVVELADGQLRLAGVRRVKEVVA